MNLRNKRRAAMTADQWLVHARNDLKLARLGLEHRVLPELVCFHSQQAAEKALKTVLLHKRIEFPLTHDLEQLLGILREAGVPFPGEVEEIGLLTPYAVETRYPGYCGAITPKDVKEAINAADATLKWAGKLVKRKR
jgi:HEPN domain-containing protein